jgi:hypothetical protein
MIFGLAILLVVSVWSLETESIAGKDERVVIVLPVESEETKATTGLKNAMREFLRLSPILAIPRVHGQLSRGATDQPLTAFTHYA